MGATTFQPTCVANECICGTDVGQLDCTVNFFAEGTALSNECTGTVAPAGTCAFQCNPGFTAGGEHVAATAHVEATCTGVAADGNYTCDSFPIVANDDTASSCPAGCDYTAPEPASPSSLECTAGGFTAGECVACATENKALGKPAAASGEAACSSGVTSQYLLDDIVADTICDASRVTDGDSTDNNMRWISDDSTETKSLVVDLEAPYLVVRADVVSGTFCGGAPVIADYSAETTLSTDQYLELDAGGEVSIAGVSIMGKAGSTQTHREEAVLSV